MKKRVLCLLFTGFEEIETIAPVDLLRRAGVEVVVASLTGDKLVTGRCQITVQADALAVEGLLDRLSAMRVRSSLPVDPAGLAARGLEPPASRLTLTLVGGKTLSLDLGDESAFDRTRFGRAGGEILVIDGVPAAALDPGPDAFLAAKAGR
jgi:hypothetical protein